MTFTLDAKAPFFFTEIGSVQTKDGKPRQSQSLKNLIKKNHSQRLVLSGYTIYALRVDSAQWNCFGKLSYLKYDNFTNKVTLEVN